jgi:hypothetical protein
MKKKLFVIFLTLCMILGLLPIQVFANADKSERKVAVKGSPVVGEELNADLSDLPKGIKTKIQWQKKKIGEKDSEAVDIGKGKESLQLKEKDEGKVFRIIVTDEDNSEICYTSKWTKKVKQQLSVKKEGETESTETETKVTETETETESKEPETKAIETETETESKEPETKAIETETESKEPETKAPETETESKQPETKAPETETESKQSETTMSGNKLLKVVTPKAIVRKNGRDKNAKSLGLPKKVKIKTSNGVRRAKVTWKVKAADYSKYETALQKFTVTGTVRLPDGVKNPDKVSRETTIQVTVQAYEPKIADASGNTITGLETARSYVANSELNFQAVGAGTANTKPKKGDTRYHPYSWSISSTTNSVVSTSSVSSGTFSADECKASAKLATAGDYILKVVYNRQAYDGNTWISDGISDTKTVTFKIITSTSTGNSNSSQTNTISGTVVKTAAQTGDNSPILKLVVVCLICVLCVAAVFLSKKKKK